jgi:hypothetical protein
MSTAAVQLLELIGDGTDDFSRRLRGVVMIVGAEQPDADTDQLIAAVLADVPEQMYSVIVAVLQPVLQPGRDVVGS